jgi:hypothetical protein
MNRFAVLALYAPLLTGTVPMEGQGRRLVGGYAPASVDDEVVREARTEIQRYFVPDLQRLAEIRQAATQVVAGLNVKLLCRVTSADRGHSLWEFVAWRRLDGSWHLISATRVGRADTPD